MDHRTESTQRRIDTAARALADALLMQGEPTLEDQVHGTSGFEKTFPLAGPFDLKNRSLRDLDLQSRLFRYRLSYLIYTPEFRGLPKEVMQPVQARLREALGAPEYKDELEILQATLPGWLVMN